MHRKCFWEHKLRYLIKNTTISCVAFSLLGSCTLHQPIRSESNNVEIINESEISDCVFITSIHKSSAGFSPSDATSQAINELKRQAIVIKGNAISVNSVSLSYKYENKYKRDYSSVNVDIYHCKKG